MSCFVRLLHNCDKAWYLNSRQVRYSVMHTTLQIRCEDGIQPQLAATDSGHLVNQELQPVHASNSLLYCSSAAMSSSDALFVISCSPVQSAYKSRDVLPNALSFSFKHSTNCLFTYIDNTAIPLCGYLPQDILNTSIFLYYHPDDLCLLLEAYKGLTVGSRKRKCDQPVRFKVKNGEYILVDTEVSCFVDPWSHHIDFVIGRHSVLR